MSDNDEYIEFNGKIAVITGGSSGIGKEILKLLVNHKCKVVNLDIADMENGSAECLHDVLFIKTDLSSSEQINKSLDIIKSKFSKIDYFIHCAAGYANSRGLSSGTEDWLRVLKVNTFSVCNIISKLHPLMKSSGFGSIVLIGSVAGSFAQNNYYAYSVSKATYISLVRELSKRFRKSGIRINLISPGTVWTERLMSNVSKYAITSKEEADKYFGQYNILKEVSTPTQVSQPVLFLLSSRTNITGKCIFVDGGFHAI